MLHYLQLERTLIKLKRGEQKMPYNILGDGDYICLQCTRCKKSITRQYVPFNFSSGIFITASCIHRLQEHAECCRKGTNKKRKISGELDRTPYDKPETD